MTTIIIPEQLIEQELPGKVRKRLASRLRPGEGAKLHRDKCPFRRFHYPIQTNDDCIFFYEDEIIKMQPGKFYEVFPQRLHGVQNNGDTDRIHLIFDLAP